MEGRLPLGYYWIAVECYMPRLRCHHVQIRIREHRRLIHALADVKKHKLIQFY
jgi:hypothetical protein